MKLLNKTAKKMGLRKPKYRQVNIKPEAYMTFRILAAQRKRNHVDFFNELLSVYVDCKHKKHEDVIAD